MVLVAPHSALLRISAQTLPTLILTRTGRTVVAEQIAGKDDQQLLGLAPTWGSTTSQIGRPGIVTTRANTRPSTRQPLPLFQHERHPLDRAAAFGRRPAQLRRVLETRGVGTCEM